MNDAQHGDGTLFKLVKGGHQDENGEAIDAYGFDDPNTDVFITDPFSSTCGRFYVGLSEYGLTNAEAIELVRLNKALGIEVTIPEGFTA